MSPRRAALLVCLLGLAAPPTAQASDAEELSDETLVTRWAHADVRASVLARPWLGARRVARLRYMTEDGLPEVYMALRRQERAGRMWLEIRVPGRPNGRTGWVPRDALGPLHTVRTQLEVDRRRLRATLRRRGRVVWSAPVGVGAKGTPTPAGLRLRPPASPA